LLHMLKGSAGSFGFQRVTDLAREMEQAVRGAAPQAVQQLMQQLMLLAEVSALYRQEEQQ
ncbi:MAG: Hpt domain-containing protein, partial [Burkholderiaceae bacterium]|nr:Hpt domain-containing protein [Burkholderiaceae bacterium]